MKKSAADQRSELLELRKQERLLQERIARLINAMDPWDLPTAELNQDEVTQ